MLGKDVTFIGSYTNGKYSDKTVQWKKEMNKAYKKVKESKHLDAIESMSLNAQKLYKEMFQ